MPLDKKGHAVSQSKALISGLDINTMQGQGNNLTGHTVS